MNAAELGRRIDAEVPFLKQVLSRLDYMASLPLSKVEVAASSSRGTQKRSPWDRSLLPSRGEMCRGVSASFAALLREGCEKSHYALGPIGGGYYIPTNSTLTSRYIAWS